MVGERSIHEKVVRERESKKEIGRGKGGVRERAVPRLEGLLVDCRRRKQVEGQLRASRSVEKIPVEVETYDRQ